MRFAARLIEIVRSLCEPNPVFRRELRARWRRPAAFLTLFFYAAPLALGMALTYADKAPTSFEEQQIFSGPAIAGFPPPAVVSTVSVGGQMAVLGRDLFFGLALLQVMTWLLIAPATAAGAIAGERERGLLEALQMANLPARRVVLGKWLSILSFMALLFLVPLPVTAICFFFGGFTPQDFARMSLTIALTAVFGSVLGLYFSSRRHRPAAALRDTLLFLVIWTSVAAFSSAKPQFFETLPLMLKRACAVAELAHPAWAMNGFNGAEFQWPTRENDEDAPFAPAYGGFPGGFAVPTMRNGNTKIVIPAPVWVPPYTTIDRESQWALNLAALAALSLLFFALAVRGTKKLLPDPTFVRRDWVARWKKRLERRNSGKQSAMGRKARQALFAEMPLLSGRSFDNPVFGRELRGKTRLRAGAWWLWIIRAALVVVPLLFYIQTLADVMEGLHRDEAWKRFSYLGLALLTLYASVSGAGAFTREREGGTWEGLKMTLLQPGQILHGKIWPLVIGIVALSLPLWPAFWLCLGNAEVISFRGYQNQITFTLWHFAVVLGILLSTAFAAGCAALFISWLSRRTPLAVGLSLVSGAFLAIAMTVPFGNAFRSPIIALDGLVKAEPFRNVVPPPSPSYYERQRSYFPKEEWRAYVALVEKEKRSLREQQATFDAQYRDAMENFREEQRGILLSPLTMLMTGTILLLILAALMRQKFRDEK